MNFYGRMPMGFSGAVSLTPVLTGLELTFMGVTQSYSGLFSTPGFLVSPVGKRERGEEKKRWEGVKKGIEKEREGRKEVGIKEDQKQDKKEF